MIEGPAYDLRAEIYDCFFGDRSAETACWLRLAQQYGDRVVEWMCGTGELAVGLAQAGLDVIGVDLVPEMLAVAARREKSEPARGKVQWIVGDMREAALPRSANDFAFVPAGSFGHLLTPEDQAKALQSARNHLRPGGGFSMTLSPAGAESFPETTRGPFDGLRPSLSGTAARKPSVRNSYDARTRLYNIHEQIELETAKGARQDFEYCFQMRHFTPDEIEQLLVDAGFGNIEMFGDLDLGPCTPGAPEWIVLATRS